MACCKWLCRGHVFFNLCSPCLLYCVIQLFWPTVRFCRGCLGASKSTQRFNIASAAFSIDERRILMVDEDVVAVVRNLHYDEIIATNNENTIIKIYWALI